MKRYLLYIVILLVLFCGISSAQAPRTDHALNFSLTQDFTYSGLYKGIGYKCYFGNLALRGSIGGEYNLSSTDTTKNLTVSFSLLYNIAETKRTLAYAGGGLIYDYRENHSRYTHAIYNIYGAALILGGEVFVLDDVSLGLENTLLYAYNTQVDLQRVIIGNFNYNSAFLINVYF